MATLHSTITGAENHEPKGVEGATGGTYYRADGTGSGAWVSVVAGEVGVASPSFPIATVEGALTQLWSASGLVVTSRIDDISNPESVLIPTPFNCRVSSIKMVLGGPITTADTVISVSRADGASMGSQTIESAGSAEGSTVTFYPALNDVLTGQDYLKIASGGGSGGNARLYLLVTLVRL